MIDIAPLRSEDREHWNILARDYKAFVRTTLTDADYDNAWRRMLAGDGAHGLGAHRDGELVGIAHYLFHTSTWVQDVCYLQDLFVDASARGHGIARALIDTVVAAARERGAQRMYWLTHIDNIAARTLYDKLATCKGFVRYDYPLEQAAARLP